MPSPYGDAQRAIADSVYQGASFIDSQMTQPQRYRLRRLVRTYGIISPSKSR
ncbi:MAG TPA: hypothetical protein V6D14_21635 [Coleofasciculaceae cyanobacterium]